MPKPLIEVIEKTKQLLGENLIISPTKEDSHRVHWTTERHHRKRLNELSVTLTNDDKCGGYKIHHDSQFDDKFTFLVIDYDDHTGHKSIPSVTARRAEFHKTHRLNPTFVVKTPTGDGIHEWYLIPIEIANSIHRNRIEYQEGVEILLGNGLKEHKTGWAGPGTYSKEADAYYRIEKELPPSEVSDSLIQWIVSHNRNYIEGYRDSPKTDPNSSIDAPENRKAASEFLGDIIYSDTKREFYLPNQLRNSRNNSYFKIAIDLAKFRVSDIFIFNEINRRINTDPELCYEPYPDEELEAVIKSAIGIANEARESWAVDSFDSIQADEYGNREIPYALYDNKATELSKYAIQAILKQPTLTKSFCSMCILHKGLIYTPAKVSMEAFDKLFNRTIEKETENDRADITSLSLALAKTALHWNALTDATFRSTYRITKNDRTKPLKDLPVFVDNCIILSDYGLERKMLRSDSPKNILEDGIFHMFEKAAIMPIPLDAPEHEQPTESELKAVQEHLYRLLGRIVDPENFEEECYHVLAREALMVQKDVMTGNVLVLQGQQNSGKTTFFDLFTPLYPVDASIKFDRVDRAKDKFNEFAYRSYFDDISAKDIRDNINMIKTTATSKDRPVEVKFVQRSQQYKNVNLSLSTNDEIKDPIVISERRISIIHNTQPIDMEAVRKEVRELYVYLPANKFRAYKVLATFLDRFDTTKFNPNFKSAYQMHLRTKYVVDTKFSARILILIYNYGYTNNESIRFPFGEETTVCTLRKYFNHVIPLSDKNHRIDQIFDGLDPNKRSKVIQMWRTAIPVGLKKIRTNVFGCTAPTMQFMIRLLAFSIHEDKSNYYVENTITKFGLQDQWNWDGTKPEIENLGSIKIEDAIDLSNFDDGEDEDDF